MSTSPWRSAASAILILTAVPVGADTAPPPRYTVVDLGASLGSSSAGLSGAGHVTGRYFGAGGQRRAFLWYQGVFSDLGTLGGIAQAAAVDAAGVVVGYSVDAEGRQRAVRVESGVMSDLGTLQGGIAAAANDLNELGWIVGMSERRFGNDTWQRPALWRDGEVLDLGTFGGEFGEAEGVNEAGQVVGWAWYPLPDRRQRAFLWSDAAGMVDLGSLGGAVSTARDVDDRGRVVGSSATALPNQPHHAFLWTAARGMVDLGTPPGAAESAAAAINNAGQIVGNSFLPDEFRAEPLLWLRGRLYRLNDLVDPASGWTVITAEDIDDRGEIAATARHVTGSYRAVLLVPVR